MKALIVIPARYQSSRLPGKPTLDCEGKPLLIRTYEQACKTVADVVIACDLKTRESIDTTSHNGTIPFVVTDKWFDSGSQRVADAYSVVSSYRGSGCYDVVINWQADEPTVSPNAVNRMIAESRNMLAYDVVSTLVNPRPLTEKQQQDQTTVKAVMMDGRCWWFSRRRVVGAVEHIGVYAFLPYTLEQIGELNFTHASAVQSLEQLAWLANGIEIAAVPTTRETISVNTKEDLERYREFLRSGKT